MATVILLRHGRSTANTGGILAGRMPGVDLDDTGREQARRAGERTVGVPLARVVSSPLERCRRTTELVLAARGEDAEIRTEPGLAECDYGDWQGRALSALTKEPLWRVVQSQPSAAVFPGGESLAAMQARAVEAVRRHDAEVEAAHGAAAVWLAVSHGDLIKAILADALGMHLDLFQRLHVDPASLSVVRYTEARPLVLGSNTHRGSLDWLAARTEEPDDAAGAAAAGDAVVGGGAGPGLGAS
ncbi:histidine phosphatase family protein [Nocardioides insulae]|uniref:histidine phosphatase family protein n=1 Tax=Nocardioides insulae TaxID=394734 RepID=UPI000416A81C|nr:histidine phosphatase family protein [Nocardioides insulae]